MKVISVIYFGVSSIKIFVLIKQLMLIAITNKPPFISNHLLFIYCLHSIQTDCAWKEIQTFAEDVLESQSPNEPLQPIQPIKKPKRKLTRTMSARFSFTRSVSREIYEQQINNSGLTDGCTPICILDTNEILASLQKASKKNLQRSKEVDIDSTDEASNWLENGEAAECSSRESNWYRLLRCWCDHSEAAMMIV